MFQEVSQFFKISPTSSAVTGIRALWQIVGTQSGVGPTVSGRLLEFMFCSPQCWLSSLVPSNFTPNVKHIGVDRSRNCLD